MRFVLIACLLGNSAVPLAAATDPAASDTVAATCGGEIAAEAYAKMPKAAQVGYLSCLTSESARQFNTELPKQIDRVTTLERVSAESTQLTYHYRLSIARTDLAPGAIETFKPTVIEKVCNAAHMRAVVGWGGRYRYEWVDKDGVEIGTLVVDSCAG